MSWLTAPPPLLVSFLHGIVHTLLMAAVAPLMTGLVRKVKSRMQGRRGPSVWQPYRDLRRLVRKESVLGEDTSWISEVAPYIVFVSVWLAATIPPSFTTDMVMAPAGDLIALVALLAVARFFTALAGLDAGTAFGGLGASREMFIASLAEPAMLMVTFSLSLLAQTTSPPVIIDFVLAGKVGLEVSIGLALLAMLMIALAETGRIPIDNPATHLELTMVHEAMVLDYSGRHLALMDAAAMLRLTLFMTILAGLFAPWGIAQTGADLPLLLLGMGSWLLKLAGLAVGLGVLESLIAKMRLFRVADFLGGALLLALLAIIFLYVSQAV